MDVSQHLRISNIVLALSDYLNIEDSQIKWFSSKSIKVSRIMETKTNKHFEMDKAIYFLDIKTAMAYSKHVSIIFHSHKWLTYYILDFFF